tara:strand:- start:460 stop:723 length:264 start_codon:yes stop_codon:yes gene_type:complete
MKPSKTRLKDVLDDKVFNKDKWNMIFGKMKKLATAIEMFKGPSMNIDDPDYRWVDDRIRYYEQEERLLTKDEMTIANEMWIKYGKKA